MTTPCLRNLGDMDSQTLLVEINQVWTENKLLNPAWKEGRMIFIPKPCKSIAASNLRPMTLISDVRKLMERMVLQRLHDHIEEVDFILYNMLRFRQQLQTQDALLALHEK